MKDEHKTKEQLIDELAEMRQRRIAELEAADTERKRAEERIEHLNFVLRAIRNVNQLITRERDRDRLLQGACETLIETRGYHNAWIALLDESGGVMTTAEAGLGEDFLSLVERLKRGELTDCGRRALKQSGGVVTEDPFSTCAGCPLSSMYGGRGAMTIRLEYGRKVYGLLSVSIPGDLVADEEGRALFQEVAGDIAFALHNVELEEERKQAEEALAGERNLLRTLIDNLPDHIYVKDTESRFVIANATVGRILGVTSPEEVIGKTDFDFHPQELAEQYYADEREIIRSGQPLVNREEPVVDQTTGDREWLLTTKVPLWDNHGEIVGLVGISRDITERKKAEEELRQLKEFNEGIVQGMEEGIVMEDAEGYITFVNPKMAEMLGYAEEELMGKHWSEAVAPSCLSQVEEESSRRREGISTRYEAVLLRKDGGEVPGLISARPLFREGEFAGTLGVFTDLTEIKEIEQQLIQAGKLAAIGELVAGVAHELNNPLTSVVGYSQLLLKSECSEEIKRDLERINRQGVRAARIVENLLPFARRREPRKESISINDVIERSLELQAHQLALDGISIVKELDEALPPAMADSFQMQQVFMNIISNAHQSLRDWGGERQLTVRSELQGDMTHLEFADSGPGIPAEVMGRLFEPFFTTREVGEGTGLGLSISYGIVEAHGGRIWAKSEVGKGATFIVEIPTKGH
jgi:PAS domain S-box-containing protein